jgi:hypothetical protein
MGQNKNQLIDLFIGNLANAIIHSILEKSIDRIELTGKYRNEAVNSYEVARRYRERINPVNKPLSLNDLFYIKEKLKNKVTTELNLRISKGYQNINLDIVDSEIYNKLKELDVE